MAKGGDKNTKFFHKMANARARKNLLSKVNINGNPLTSAEDIKDGFRVLGSERAKSLEEPFSEKEVFEALHSLSGDKVPGPDGFTMAFWQFSWDFTKAEILAFFDEFFRLGTFQRSLNSTFLVLIPKKGGAEELKDFRPISLILDAALIANEAIDSRLKVNIPGLLLKLDIEKAFDHVNWDCLVSVMGLRQGDPLSPYLFLLVMEVLNQLLFRARSGGFIEGFKVGNNNGIERDLIHLLFADDTLLFCKADSGQLRYLSWVLLWFEAISGLKVNRDKSEVILIGRVDYLENIISVLGCRIRNLPSSYLGLPLGAPFKSLRVCARLEKIQRDFLWGGGALERKTHLVKWSVVCTDMRQGGLGIRSLVALNKALLGKWDWKFAIERNSLWKQVIIDKYGEEERG
ncbi:Transposon TX1 uncharacterized 149 kDa protein [Vitis vinifera]|uniref:Transposon TX1 uncharacterized 149 kDa protein n=1 Tax=Vitis vinifera TaxID=29760 RepID=A0A438I0A3_VITVI|nr:Transposon TX1 uncharacterized 149 kDa protein [Vitis vinifera]